MGEDSTADRTSAMSCTMTISKERSAAAHDLIARGVKALESSLGLFEKSTDLAFNIRPYEEMEDSIRLESLLQILKWIQALQILDDALARAFSPGKVGEAPKRGHLLPKRDDIDDEDCWTLLPSLYGRLRALSLCLSGSGCKTLKRYAEDLTNRWKDTLQTYFFNEITEKFRWPLIILEEDSADTDRNLCQNLARSYAALDYVTQSAIELLVRPLEKRFKFHFSGNKKTNLFNKPEWYIQQIWKWIRKSENFFGGILSRSVHEELTAKLLEILNTKLRSDLSVISDDVSLFGHAIDEILGITKDVLNYEYLPPDDINLPVSVLCDENVFPKWIDLEKKLAFEKLDRILLDERAWTESSADSQISKCTIKFLALLECMTERYRFITSNELKLKFIELQKELVEDLRLRFVKVSRQEQDSPVNDKFCLILNSSRHIIHFVSRWSELPFMIRLESDLNNEVGLFHVSLGRLDFVVNDMIRILGDYVFYEVKARSRGYIYRDWTYTSPQGNESVSSDSLPMIQTLLSHLNSCHEKLHSDLFSSATDLVFIQIKDFLIHDVILENKFSFLGCQQLRTDITKGFLLVFNQYGIDQIDDLNDISVLLNLNDASAMLLLEELEGEKSLKKIGTLMTEFNLRSITQEQVASVLKRRILKNL